MSVRRLWPVLLLAPLGVVVAHDRAVGVFDRVAANRSQEPLLAVMVTYTVGGLALLLGS